MDVVGYILSCETDKFLQCDHCGYSDNENKSVHGKFRWSIPETQVPEDGEDYYNNMQSMRTWGIE